MTTKQINDMTTQQEESQREALGHLEAIYWGGVIIWVGLVFGADSLGYLPQIGGAGSWSWIFFGAGLYGLLMALFRESSEDYPSPTAWDYVWAGIFLILGLSGIFAVDIAWPVILVVVGIAILGKAFFRQRE